MQIQINTDHNIEGTEALAAHIKEIVASSLAHVSDHVTRLEVHLADENADKAGPQDKRCRMEARLEGRQPTAVTHHAESLHEAVAGAAAKLERSLASTLDRLRDH